MHGTTLICGVIGSHAYGMATAGSDKDRFGVFTYPTEDFLGLMEGVRPLGVRDPASDHAEHEVRHFLNLALGSNPAMLELLWLPEYELATPTGWELVGLRNAFLSAPKVFSTYLGYAGEQFRRMQRQTPAEDTATVSKRTKNARHLLRLLDQGTHLYATGELLLKVEVPQRYFDFGTRAVMDPEVARKELVAAEEKFKSTRSPLPAFPDKARVEGWLRNFRLRHLREAPQPQEHFPWGNCAS